MVLTRLPHLPLVVQAKGLRVDTGNLDGPTLTLGWALNELAEADPSALDDVLAGRPVRTPALSVLPPGETRDPIPPDTRLLALPWPPSLVVPAADLVRAVRDLLAADPAGHPEDAALDAKIAELDAAPAAAVRALRAEVYRGLARVRLWGPRPTEARIAGLRAAALWRVAEWARSMAALHDTFDLPDGYRAGVPRDLRTVPVAADWFRGAVDPTPPGYSDAAFLALCITAVREIPDADEPWEGFTVVGGGGHAVAVDWRREPGREARAVPRPIGEPQSGMGGGGRL